MKTHLLLSNAIVAILIALQLTSLTASGQIEINQNGEIGIHFNAIPGVDCAIQGNKIAIFGEQTKVTSKYFCLKPRPGEYLLYFQNDNDEVIMRPENSIESRVGSNTHVMRALTTYKLFSRYNYRIGGGGAVVNENPSKEKFKNPIDILMQTKMQLLKLSDKYLINATEKTKKQILEEDNGQLGFLAEELEEFLPEAVCTDKETGFKFVDYNTFIPLIIECIKTQQKEIDILKTENKQYKNKLNK